MTLAFDRFLRHDQLGAALRDLAVAHPELVRVEVIGRSHEGREIWLVTVTDATTGPHDEKPAMWVDANIHATELTASVAALHLLHHLCTSDDPTVEVARRTRTFYVVPRVNPDGAELALADRPRLLRSSTRPWPWRDAWRRPGLHVEDVDGDGLVLTMRVPDPDGAWTSHPDDPRLLVPRAPDALPGDGPAWRLLAEGRVEGYDGFTLPQPPPPEGLDLNRNYPAGWGTAVSGAGDYPGSEPETAAVIAAMRARPNICGFDAYHTYGGVLLRPSSTMADATLPPSDVWAWTELGRIGTELTGYPVHSVFEDFTWDKRHLMAGASDDWAYEHLGIHAWTTEFWDVVAHVTGERSPTTIWVTGPTPEQEFAVLRWADEHFPGRLFHEWRPFEHPDLGQVEIGGWDVLRSWVNPPAELLLAEVAPHARFAVAQALAAPALAVRVLRVEPLGGPDGGVPVWRVVAGVANTGWLPTTVTERAAIERLVLPVVADLEVVDGTVLDGPARRELGQLAGRSRVRLDGFARSDGGADRALATWLVRAPAGAAVTVTARHQRAGVARAHTALTPPDP